jgi:hypothetical protein
VQFKRVPVDPDKEDIFAFPVIFMSGSAIFSSLKPRASASVNIAIMAARWWWMM